MWAVHCVLLLVIAKSAYCTVHVNEAKARELVATTGHQEGDDLQGLLHWAIEHSGPGTPDAKAQGANDALHARRVRVQELMDAMKMQSTEADLMKECVELVRNQNASMAQRVAALSTLQEIVEDIDNANDLPKMDGIPVLIDALSHPEPLQVAALKVIATAASNNMVFQEAVFRTEAAIVPGLLQLIASKHGQKDSINIIAAATHALASLAANRPSSSTGLLSPHLSGTQTDNDAAECAPGLRLLIHVALDSSQHANSADLVMQRANKLVLHRSLGLLTDLASNDLDVRQKLRSCTDIALSWTGVACRQFKQMQSVSQVVRNRGKDLGRFRTNLTVHADLCKQLLPSPDDSMARALDLLQEIAKPDSQPWSQSWASARSCLRSLEKFMDQADLSAKSDLSDMSSQLRAISNTLSRDMRDVVDEL